MHIYHRNIDINGTDSLSKIARSITKNSTVLDIGTGAGALGFYLKSINCVVDGLNYNEKEIEIAKPAYRDIYLINLEDQLPSTRFKVNTYDYIIFADVLEHIRNPKEVLADAISLLNEGGKIIISIPNIAYIGVIADLIAGEFNYNEEGILDRTHVHFFTRNSLIRLFDECNLVVTQWNDVTKPICESEFKHRNCNTFDKAVIEKLLKNNDLNTYQIIATLEKNDQAIKQLKAPTYNPEINFVTQFYFKNEKSEYTENNSIKIYPSIGNEKQTYIIDLPNYDNLVIRADISDRPGILNLYNLSILDENNFEIYSTSTSKLPIIRTNEIIAINNNIASDGMILSIIGSNNYLELPLAFNNSQGNLKLSISMSWPASQDTLATFINFKNFKKEQLEQSQNALAITSTALMNAETIVDEKNNIISILAKEIENTRNALSNAEAIVNDKNDIISTLTHEIQNTQYALSNAEAIVNDKNQIILTLTEQYEKAIKIRDNEILKMKNLFSYKIFNYFRK